MSCSELKAGRVGVRQGAIAVPLLLGCFLAACSADGPGNSSSSLNMEQIFGESAGTVTGSVNPAEQQWAQAFSQNPASVDAAINYADALKYKGDKRGALSVLARAFQTTQQNPRVASAYGRLALDMKDVALAEKVLRYAGSPEQGDWRLLSAHGTIAANKRDFKKAQGYFLRALQLQPTQATVMNNLALVYALDGKLPEAENLLKRAVSVQGNNERLRRNLDLITQMRAKQSGGSGNIAQVPVAGSTLGASGQGATVPSLGQGNNRSVGAPTTLSPQQVQPIRPSASVSQATPVVTQRSNVVVPSAQGRSSSVVASAPSERDLPKQRVVTVSPPKTIVSDKAITIPVRKPSVTASNATVRRKSSPSSTSKPTAVSPPPANLPAPLMRSGTYDDSLSGWSFEVEG